MSAAHDCGDTRQDFRSLVCQQLEVRLWEGLSIRPQRIYLRQIDGAIEGRRPISPGGVEMRVRDDDHFQAAEFIDLYSTQLGTCALLACKLWATLSTVA